MFYYEVRGNPPRDCQGSRESSDRRLTPVIPTEYTSYD